MADPDASATGEIITVTLADARGLLSASTNAIGGGGAITGSGTTQLTITGTLAEVDADLTTLADHEKSAGTDTISVTATDGRGGNAAPLNISVSGDDSVSETAPASLLATPGVSLAVGGVQVVEGRWTGQHLQRHAQRRNRPPQCDRHGGHRLRQRQPDHHGNARAGQCGPRDAESQQQQSRQRHHHDDDRRQRRQTVTKSISVSVDDSVNETVPAFLSTRRPE